MVSVAAAAGVHPAMIDPMVIANAASNRPRHRIVTMVLSHLSSGVLVAIAWIGLMRTTTVRRGRNQFRCISTSSIGITGAPAGVDPHFAAINPAQLLQALQKSRAASLAMRIVRRQAHGHADAPHALALLRPRHNRQRCRTADQ